MRFRLLLDAYYTGARVHVRPGVPDRLGDQNDEMTPCSSRVPSARPTGCHPSLGVVLSNWGDWPRVEDTMLDRELAAEEDRKEQEEPGHKKTSCCRT